MLPKIIDICHTDLFTAEDELLTKYNPQQVQHIVRLRDMYNWFLSFPDATDRQFVDEFKSRYQLGRSKAFADLALIKTLLPSISSASRDFHRFRYNEMILETYHMAKARKDTKTMEKAASSYAKFNRVDLEDEQAVPYEDIVIQPFVPTMDPTVLGMHAVPNLDRKIQELLKEMGTSDIEDIEFEEVDLEEKELFPLPQETNG
ncbi:MAG: hypothetical protein MJZ82_03085 [Paludibacteraceae bacterium]|nr:hypothetical protein [Paludibacteraceae bacterium]